MMLGVAGCPRWVGSGQATKRRETALLAVTFRGATGLGAQGGAPPSSTIENPEFMIYNFTWVRTNVLLGENNGLCKKSL